MTDIIQLLPDSVANQIAAGEVVQRPASAVKEIMENAIDAGAEDIKLFIKDAGKTLIQITDNGIGMSETDARMCFERHATSKIKKADDLFSIKTMGFRGEAMASIAAIAHVELKTKRREDELGTHLIVEGSEIKEQSECVCANGTTIWIKNLFYNVPARRNFLKSNNAELRHIIEEFQRIAMANEHIALEIQHNGKLIHQLKPTNSKQRISALIGSNYGNKIIPVEQETDLVRIRGFIGKPEFARKTRGEQYFFANGRFIKHHYLNHAVVDAFEDLIPDGAYPSYFIFLDVDPNQIDVNIHPTKTEVNFQDQQVIYAMLRSAVKQSLGKFSLGTEIDFEVEQSMQFDFNPPPDKEIVVPTLTLDPDYNPFKSVQSNPQANQDSRTRSNRENWQKLYEQSDIDTSFIDQNNSQEDDGHEPGEEDKPVNLSPSSSFDSIDVETNGKYFQIHGKYIITNVKSGMMYIHQQYAHERIIFEEMLNRINGSSGASQQLLFPETIQFDAADADLMIELQNDLHSVGFQIEKMSDKTFVVNGVPVELADQDVKDHIDKLLENYKTNLINIGNDRNMNLAMSLARNLSIKAMKFMKDEEMQDLVDRLFACQVPEVSPTGKMIVHIMRVDDIEELFK